MNWKILFAFLLILCFIAPVCAEAEEAPSVSAQSCILMDAVTGEVFYAKNESEMHGIASITKIMTGLIVCETMEFDELVTVNAEDTLIEGSSVDLKAGEKLSVRELLYGLMLSSGNDAALVLARAAAGSEGDFIKLMNEKAAELGCRNTSFVNPHGLDSEQHYSTAEDMAIIAAAALENPQFAQIVSTITVSFDGNSYSNHNKLLNDGNGVVGVKTGYTSKCGRTLVSCTERNGLKLICVTLNDPNDWDDHRALTEWACASYGKTVVLDSSELLRIPVISGLEEDIGVAPADVVSVPQELASSVEIKISAPRFVYAGVTAGDKCGVVEIIKDGECIAEADLIFTETVELNENMKLTLWEKIKRALRLSAEYNAYGYYVY